MRPALKSIGTAAAQIAAVVLIERLIPAIATALVAAGHELHFESAHTESVRRAKS